MIIKIFICIFANEYRMIATRAMESQQTVTIFKNRGVKTPLYCISYDFVPTAMLLPKTKPVQVFYGASMQRLILAFP